MAPTVRPAGPGDLPGVLRVHERDPSLGPSGVKAVGVVSLQTMPNLGYDCRPSAFLEAMVVAEGHRRRGVGRLLEAEGFRLYLDR